MPDPDLLLAHIAACHTARLPGARRRFLLGRQHVGWVDDATAAALARSGVRAEGEDMVLDDAARLPGIARAMADQGIGRFRNEAFDVRATPDGPVLSTIDRGVLPRLGIAATGVHLNGLVRRADGLHVWVARRAANKLLDPGKLDHIVGGGVSAGHDPWQTLLKESAEEAALPEALAAQSRQVAVLAYAMDRPEGLRRDRLVCYDLELPEDFIPQAADGEVESFELWPAARVLEAARHTDAFKFNVTLVLVDLFLRHGLIDPTGAEGLRLRAALEGRFEPG